MYIHLVSVFMDVRSDPRTPLLLPPLRQMRAFGCLCTPARRGWRWSHTSVCPVEPTPTSGSRPERRSSSNSSECNNATVTVTVVQTVQSQQVENSNVTNYQVWYWLIFSNYDPKVEKPKARSRWYSDCLLYFILWTIPPTRMKRLY